MGEYPYDSVVIMSDSVFTAYGGETGTSTPSQRQAAYYMAEEAMCRHLDTLLSPTILTGTVYPHGNGIGETDWGMVREVHKIFLSDHAGWEQSITAPAWFLRDGRNGYVHAGLVIHTYAPNQTFDAINMDVSYTAGLPTGTSMRPNMLQALTVLSDIALKEMGPVGMNESVGDVGVRMFSSNGYSEQRVELIRSALGTSARANYAYKLVNGLKLNRVGVIR